MLAGEVGVPGPVMIGTSSCICLRRDQEGGHATVAARIVTGGPSPQQSGSASV